MTIPSSRSLILWISVFSITSPSADFGCLRKTSDVFGRLQTSSGIFGNNCVVFKNPSTPRIKISPYISEKVGRYTFSTYTSKMIPMWLPNRAKPECGTTCCKQPPPIKDHQSKTPKFSQ